MEQELVLLLTSPRVGATQEQLTILLQQGVRTMSDVRLLTNDDFREMGIPILTRKRIAGAAGGNPIASPAELLP